jgi:hypothetical protein
MICEMARKPSTSSPKKGGKTNQKFADWLLRKFVDWQLEKREGANATKFGRWIDPKIPQQYMSRWLNGFVPNQKNIDRLAKKLGPEVYDILGIERPVTDPRLKGINQVWYDLPEEIKNRVSETVERTVGRKVGDGEEAGTSEPNVGVPE